MINLNKAQIDLLIEVLNLEYIWRNYNPITPLDTDQEIDTKILSCLDNEPKIIINIASILYDLKSILMTVNSEGISFRINCHQLFNWGVNDSEEITTVDLYKCFIKFIIGDEYAFESFAIQQRNQPVYFTEKEKIDKYYQELSNSIREYKPVTLYKAYTENLLDNILIDKK